MSFNLTLEKFLSYKPLNRDMLPELHSFANNMSYKIKGGRRRRGLPPWKKGKRPLIVKKQKDPDQLVISHIKGCLNRLSRTNFNDVLRELTNLKLTKHEHLQKLVDDVLFQKSFVRMEEGGTSLGVEPSKKYKSWCLKPFLMNFSLSY